MTDAELIQISKEIYEWKHVQQGNINVSSLLYVKWTTLKHKFGGVDNFSTHLLMEVEKDSCALSWSFILPVFTKIEVG